MLGDRSLKPRLGLTVLEFVVVFAIVGVGLILIVLKTARVREASRAHQCSDNLRRIGVALQAYHQSYGMLPPAAMRKHAGEPLQLKGMTSQNNHYTLSYGYANWAVLLLPYLDHNELAQSVATDVAITDPKNRPIQTAEVSVMKCPTDPYNRPDNPYRLVPLEDQEVAFSRGNYAINGGVSANEESPGFASRPVPDGLRRTYIAGREAPIERVWGSGIAGFNKSFSIQDFDKGLSNLVAIDEIRAGILPADSRGAWALGEIGASVTFWHGLLGDASGPNSTQPRADDILGCNQLHQALGEEALVDEGMPCCSYTVAAGQATARSLHPGGVHSLLLDGATKFFSNSVDPSVWHAMHSRESGETTVQPSRDALTASAAAPPPEAPQQPNTPGKLVNAVGMELMRVYPGEFIMGLPDEGQDHPTPVTGTPSEVPPHRVRITGSFYLASHEVTQGQYVQVMGTNPSWHTMEGGGRLDVVGKDASRFPVEQVSWEEATLFCRRLTELAAEAKAGRRYRLPTEAEWEYCCRAGSTVPFNPPNNLIRDTTGYNVQLHPNTTRPVTEVGSYEPNAFGMYDMRGNVWEWCSDWFARDYYSRSPQDDPRGPADGVLKVVRGADWRFTGMGCKYDSSHAASWRKNPYIGFRVVCEVQE